MRPTTAQRGLHGAMECLWTRWNYMYERMHDRSFRTWGAIRFTTIVVIRTGGANKISGSTLVRGQNSETRSPSGIPHMRVHLTIADSGTTLFVSSCGAAARTESLAKQGKRKTAVKHGTAEAREATEWPLKPLETKYVLGWRFLEIQTLSNL